MTELEVRSALSNYSTIGNRIKNIAIECACIRNVSSQYRSFHIENEVIFAYFEESHCSCCQPDSYEIEFPLSYLWMDDYIDIEKSIRVEKEESFRRWQEQESEREEKEREERERATYERLKEKYG